MDSGTHPEPNTAGVVAWRDLSVGARTCRFVNRSAELCARPADFVVEYGISGVGACRRHVASQLAWVMSDGGHLGVRVFPGHRDTTAEALLDGD